MLSLETFVISDADDEDDMEKALKDERSLDPLDFAIHGYPVDEVIYSMVGSALARG